MTNRNYLIDLLRFLAAVWVALFHFNGMIAFQNNWYFEIAYKGYLGVPVFFCNKRLLYIFCSQSFHNFRWILHQTPIPHISALLV
jgi:hypothetical protein